MTNGAERTKPTRPNGSLHSNDLSPQLELEIFRPWLERSIAAYGSDRSRIAWKDVLKSLEACEYGNEVYTGEDRRPDVHRGQVQLWKVAFHQYCYAFHRSMARQRRDEHP